MTGVIKEGYAKLLAAEGAWDSALVEFQEAFKAFDEAGLYTSTVANLQVHAWEGGSSLAPTYTRLTTPYPSTSPVPFAGQHARAYRDQPL